MRLATGGIACEPGFARMIRWLAVVFLALVVFGAIGPWLEKLGLGRLPGDFRFRLAGRVWFISFHWRAAS